MAIESLPCSVALSHHWLVRRRGGEKVLDALAALAPDAPVHTLVFDRAGMGQVNERAGEIDSDATIRLAGTRRPLITSWLQSLPGVARYYPKLLPLLPAAARSMRVAPARLVVCSDAAIAKAMTVDDASRLVCYCHSPMRYVWEESLSEHYRATLPSPLRPLWPLVCASLRSADAAAARRVDHFIANSRTVAKRIDRCYGRAAEVIHPPADVPDAPPPPTRRAAYYLAVGHHVAYKRLDLAVEACRKLGRHLVVIGDGPDAARMRARQSNGVEFLGYQPDSEVIRRYGETRGLLFPGEEDFGIVPVEAMAHGCPVIAFGRGGATESVIDGVTGVLFGEQSAESLAEAILTAEARDFDPVAIHARAAEFSLARFLERIRRSLSDQL